MPAAPRDFRLTVLNPSGKDSNQDFSDGAGAPDERLHAPINFHAYAAATRGAFLRDTAEAVRRRDPVLLLVRSDPRAALSAFRTLDAEGVPVAASWKECGTHQFAEQLAQPRSLRVARELLTDVGLALAPTPASAALYAGLGARTILSLPTPYPLDDPRWDFRLPTSQRDLGILLGTREFSVPTRNHLLSLALLRMVSVETGIPVTVFVSKREREARKLIEALDFPPALLNLQQTGLPYPRYLQQVARHRAVFQLDGSSVPGQVAGDALLAGVPCVGGNGAVDRAGFPQWTVDHSDPAAALSVLKVLVSTAQTAADAGTAARAVAERTLGFRQAAAALREFFHPASL